MKKAFSKNQGKKIGIAGNHSTTLDTAQALLDNGYEIDCLINMGSDLDGSIAGYIDASPFARKNKIRLIRPFTYSLKDERDKLQFLKRKLDVLIVFGWQRLIPDWLLESLSIGAFGTHGSPEGLPRGRGRSLGNWSLIRGQKILKDNLFRYDIGVDSGEVVETRSFEITAWDTIASLHHKDQLFQQLTLLKHLPGILKGKYPQISQSTRIKPTYYPKRTFEDGVIDWSWKTMDLYNLVRALTKPYLGAYTLSEEKIIMIWEAIPFENFEEFKIRKPGTILAAFADGTFVVKTGDGTLLIQNYDSKGWKPIIGQKFKSGVNRSMEKLKEAGII